MYRCLRKTNYLDSSQYVLATSLVCILPTCHADLVLTSRAKLFTALCPQHYSWRHNLEKFNSESVSNNNFRFVSFTLLTRKYAAKFFPERNIRKVNVQDNVGERFSTRNNILRYWTHGISFKNNNKSDCTKHRINIFFCARVIPCQSLVFVDICLQAHERSAY